MISSALRRTSIAFAFSLAGFALAGVHAAETKKAKTPKAPRVPKVTNAIQLADWVEPDFPFFSSVLDARKAGATLPANNLTPRGIILNLSRDCWACFDPDLL